MVNDWFVVHDGLMGAARFPSPTRPRQRISTAELALLLTCGARPFDSWWLQAAVTYTLSGAVAGLLGAVCWFHFNDRSGGRTQS
jgi:hypothetical protein